jgi:exodeoxyribonuclease V alpha subunit
VSEELIKIQARIVEIIREEGTESDRYFLDKSLPDADKWVSQVYVNYPFGLSWQGTEALGRVFCPQDRLAGSILYFLNNKITQEGHTCYPLSLLFGALKINFPHQVKDKQSLEPSLRKLIDLGKVMVKNKAIWIQHTFADESQILAGIRDCVSRQPDLDIPLEAFTADLTDAQAEAIRALSKARLLILDGYPGTGKTFSSAKIVKYLEAEGYSVTLLAPTGLAAKNLKDRCKKHASTIHSFVLSRKNNDSPLHGRQAFLIDEFSMVDSRILSEFFEVIQDTTPIIIFVGDTNQLPSVGPGNLLAEVISLKDKFNLAYVQLTQIIRQKTGSEIAHNAALIRQGKTNIINDSEFKFYEMPESDIPDMILRSAQKMMNEKREFVVLSPVKKGPCGVDALNSVLREIFNPPAIQKREVNDWREGDKILVNRNFYDFGLVNGDIGVIKEIQSAQKMLITVADKEYLINGEVILNLKHAYALTVHKAQGQEFETVLMPFVDSFGVMLKNRLLYTAITRAKRKCVVFGSTTALNKAIRNTKDQDRFTGLQLIEIGKPSWGK